MEDSIAYKNRYRLSQGTQVRAESFGLLFYTMRGPRLYFLSSGELLDSDFFSNGQPFDQWIEQHCTGRSVTESRLKDLKRNLDYLKKKGVILEY